MSLPVNVMVLPVTAVTVPVTPGACRSVGVVVVVVEVLVVVCAKVRAPAPSEAVIRAPAAIAPRYFLLIIFC